MKEILLRRKSLKWLGTICSLVIIFSIVNGAFLCNVNAASASRQGAVNAMNAFASVKWYPTANLYIWAKGACEKRINPATGTYYLNADGTVKLFDKIDTYKGNYYYSGMPYSQATPISYSAFLQKMTLIHSAPDLYRLTVISGSAGASEGYPGKYANDCAKAVWQAWQLSGSTIGSISTYSMLTAVQSGFDGMRKVGVYTSNLADTNTICNNNGYDVMEDAYQLLQKGDACFYRNEGKGHAIMVVSVSSTGIYYTDQIGSGSDKSRLLTYCTTWHISTFMNWQDLFLGTFVPVTATAFD